MSAFDDEQGRPKSLTTLEREAIVNALDHTRWSGTRTARLLGIGRSTLYRKIAEYGINRGEMMPTADPGIERHMEPMTADVVEGIPRGTFGSPEANAALHAMLAAERERIRMIPKANRS